jgi:hypothetical protein
MSLPTRPLACKRWYHIQRWRNTMVLLLILHLQLRIDTDERLSLVQQVLRICTDNLDENKKVLGQFGQQFLIFRQSLIFSFVAIISPGFSCSLSSWSKVSLGLAFSWNWTSVCRSTKADESLWLWVAWSPSSWLWFWPQLRYPMSLVLPVKLLAG